MTTKTVNQNPEGLWAIHAWEQRIWNDAPNLGKYDKSACLANWLKRFCGLANQENAKGTDIALAHRLVAQRIRIAGLIRERDEAGALLGN